MDPLWELGAQLAPQELRVWVLRSWHSYPEVQVPLALNGGQEAGSGSVKRTWKLEPTTSARVKGGVQVTLTGTENKIRKKEASSPLLLLSLVSQQAEPIREAASERQISRILAQHHKAEYLDRSVSFCFIVVLFLLKIDSNHINGHSTVTCEMTRPLLLSS